MSGGSAERDGMVRVGDMILAVDDREVGPKFVSMNRAVACGGVSLTSATPPCVCCLMHSHMHIQVVGEPLSTLRGLILGPQVHILLFLD